MRLHVKSIPEAIPAICKALATEVVIEVYLPNEGIGYWACLKPSDKPADQMTRAELARAYRRHKNPQPYDVDLIEWSGFMYRGYNKSRKSSAF